MGTLCRGVIGFRFLIQSAFLPFILGLVLGSFLVRPGQYLSISTAPSPPSVSVDESSTTGRVEWTADPGEMAIRSLKTLQERPRGNCSFGRPVRLLFTVMSTPNSHGAQMRNLARNTIYKNLTEGVVVKYMLGTSGLNQGELKKLTQENSQFKDLVLLDSHKDQYYQLPQKVMLSFQWAHKNAEFDYLLKTDDDALVRIDKLLAALKELGCPEKLYWGHSFVGWYVATKGKWGETKWFLCDTFLPYNAGLGYVIGKELVRLVIFYGDYLRRYRLEDATMGLWLSPFNLTFVNDKKRFATSFGCSDDMIIVHQFHYKNFKKSTDNLAAKGKLC